MKQPRVKSSPCDKCMEADAFFDHLLRIKESRLLHSPFFSIPCWRPNCSLGELLVCLEETFEFLRGCPSACEENGKNVLEW